MNVAAELGLEGSAEISPERVVAADPEIVLLSALEGRRASKPGHEPSHPAPASCRA